MLNILKKKGGKFENFKYLWDKMYDKLNNYEYFFILDDDIIFDSYTDINRMFNMAQKYKTWIIAPTYKIDGYSKISHKITKSNNKYLLRYVNFIEVGVPLFNNYAINKFMKYYDNSLIGWGIDYFYIWTLCKNVKDKYILVDDITVINSHDNSKGGERENKLVKGFDNEILYWDNMKQSYIINNFKHITHKYIYKI